jgi:hypothetical protein
MFAANRSEGATTSSFMNSSRIRCLLVLLFASSALAEEADFAKLLRQAGNTDDDAERQELSGSRTRRWRRFSG